jgi:hypothetical protein
MRSAWPAMEAMRFVRNFRSSSKACCVCVLIYRPRRIDQPTKAASSARRGFAWMALIPLSFLSFPESDVTIKPQKTRALEKWSFVSPSLPAINPEENKR